MSKNDVIQILSVVTFLVALMWSTTVFFAYWIYSGSHTEWIPLGLHFALLFHSISSFLIFGSIRDKESSEDE